MRVVWLNDIHLNFVYGEGLERLLQDIRGRGADCVLIAGDIAEASSVVGWLRIMACELGIPLYFVLGNHDFYGGSIRGVRTSVGEVAMGTSGLTYLTASGAVALCGGVALVGHDGWGDGRLGDPQGSRVQLNDFLLIEELAGLKRKELLARLNGLGDEAAQHLRAILQEAFGFANHVVVLTHVPPFAGAAWYGGQISAPDWLPFFSCRAAGLVLSEEMSKRPGQRMTVLCGHTHGGGKTEILPNLTVYTGAAEYGKPCVQAVLEWPTGPR